MTQTDSISKGTTLSDSCMVDSDDPQQMSQFVDIDTDETYLADEVGIGGINTTDRDSDSPSF